MSCNCEALSKVFIVNLTVIKNIIQQYDATIPSITKLELKVLMMEGRSWMRSQWTFMIEDFSTPRSSKTEKHMSRFEKQT